MLVETAFLSNPTEEKRLRTANYQQKLASAVFQGVKRYQIAYADNGRAEYLSRFVRRMSLSRTHIIRH